jgi:hypothetical protein
MGWQLDVWHGVDAAVRRHHHPSVHPKGGRSGRHGRRGGARPGRAIARWDCPGARGWGRSIMPAPDAPLLLIPSRGGRLADRSRACGEAQPPITSATGHRATPRLYGCHQPRRAILIDAARRIYGEIAALNCAAAADPALTLRRAGERRRAGRDGLLARYVLDAKRLAVAIGVAAATVVEHMRGALGRARAQVAARQAQRVLVSFRWPLEELGHRISRAPAPHWPQGNGSRTAVPPRAAGGPCGAARGAAATESSAVAP